MSEGSDVAANRKPGPAPAGAAEGPSTPAPAPVAAKRSGGFAILVLSFVAGLIGGLISGVAVGILPVKWPGSSAAQVASLRTALEQAHIPALQLRLAELEKRLPTGVATTPAFSELGARLQTAEQQLSALSGQISMLSAPSVPGSSSDARNMTSGLAASLTEVKGRVEVLSAEIRAAQNLAARLAAIETRVPADLGAQLAALAAKGDVSALDQRVAKLEANTSAADAKRAAGMIALANLVRTAQSGSPFGAELEAVRFLNVDPTLIRPLATYASQGVRPVAQLAEAFGRVETAALRAAGRNWWDRLWAGLFVVKSSESKDGAGTEAILSRAKAAARAGNLQDAVGELSRLGGPAADAAAAWRAQAEARLTLDSLLTRLSVRILADLNG